MKTKRTIVEILDISVSKPSMPSVSTFIDEEAIPRESDNLKGKPKRRSRSNSSVSFWASVFEENEIQASKTPRGGKDDYQLRSIYLSKLSKVNSYRAFCARKSLESMKTTVGMYRTKYNKQELFLDQPDVCLMSIRYNEEGFPLKHSSSFADWSDVRKRCIELKIADPRFFTDEELDKLRNAKISGDSRVDGWRIPSVQEIKRLEAKIGKPIFDSIAFPRGWGRDGQ